LFIGGLREYPKMVEKFEKKFLGTWWVKPNSCDYEENE
jgi:hypothetical protein